ncbi:YncE family protein [Telmatocola sphagniphila]|uniref:YncE family protein n=1 Tax=Telmatocola sphagniphila TaxID=1123043 RepID=A0A8E6B9G4_9BACT|nr:YncE family protein [Telmatocola sphagniphila]QVL33591.1 YncE family protein [Telmatocola sphagniphila]
MKFMLKLALLALFSVSPLKAGELELIKTIPLKGKAGLLDHMDLDTKRDRLLVANKPNNTMDVVDLKSGELIKQIPNQTGIQGVAFAADLDRIYVGLGTNGLCNVFDAESYKSVKTIKFADDADNVHYFPKTQMAYVGHAEKSLGVISAKSNTLKADIKLPGTVEGFVLEANRPRLYASTPEPSQVVVIDTQKNIVSTVYPIKLSGGAHPIALDEANHRLYVACRKEPMVVVLDSETGKEITSVAIPEGADDLYFDATRKRVYVSCGSGFLAIIKVVDADHLQMIEKLPTAPGARTSLLIPETGKLYLGVPKQEGKEAAEIRIYQAKP